MADIVAFGFSDLKYALRALGRRPGFSSLVVLTLGLGIGATTAIFSTVNGLLLRDPPFREPDRLVRITSMRGDQDTGTLSVPELDDLLALPVIADAAMYTDQGMYNASGFGTPEELESTITTHNLFRVLGVEPLVGSTFPAGFDRTRNFGLVISHGLWVRKFGRDPNIVGRTMTLDGAPGYTIYGVMPPEFNFPSHSDLFRSSGISANPLSYQRRDLRDRYVIARLRPEVSVQQARAVVDGLAERLAREFPATNAGVRFRVMPIREMYSAQARPYVLLLFAAVLLVLVVACANVANLLLSRAIGREQETAVRVALGGGRWRVIRGFLAESVVLAIGGGLVGAGLAMGGVRMLTALVPVQLPPWMHVHLDVWVWSFLAAASGLTAIVTGLVPALRTTSGSPLSALNDATRGSSGARHHRLRNLLVITEVALAMALIAGASLMLQSVWRLQRVDLGFNTASALTFRVELGWRAYSTLDQTLAFHRAVLDRIRALPSVQAVTFDNNLPVSGKPRDPVAIRVEGQSRDDEARNPYVNAHLVGPDYFNVMGIALRAGRAFDDRDRAGGLPVAIVSQRLAERLWPGRDPIGQRIQTQDTAEPNVWPTVIGIGSPTLHHELDAEPTYDMYRPYSQVLTAGPFFVIRTAGDPMAIASSATGIIGAIDPNQSFLDVRAYHRRVSHRIWQRRLAGVLFGGFAALAMLLAAVGLYGVLLYVVTQHTREIGVRMALGATPRGIIGDLLWRGLRLTVAGVIAGLVVAMLGSQLISSLLYGVSPMDPATFVAVPVVLLLVAGVACYLPARRATRIDPIEALRDA
jgi:putative ABC transport system permease protein